MGVSVPGVVRRQNKRGKGERSALGSGLWLLHAALRSLDYWVALDVGVASALSASHYYLSTTVAHGLLGRIDYYLLQLAAALLICDFEFMARRLLQQAGRGKYEYNQSLKPLLRHHPATITFLPFSIDLSLI